MRVDKPFVFGITADLATTFDRDVCTNGRLTAIFFTVRRSELERAPLVTFSTIGEIIAAECPPIVVTCGATKRAGACEMH